MKITILGSGAISYPLAFCNCDNCKTAREHKGKSIRKSSALLINDDLIIDLGPDVQIAMAMYDEDMGKIKYVLQTHVHYDHYDATLLCSRSQYMVDKKQNTLEIYASLPCLKTMSEQVNRYENVDFLSEEGARALDINSNIINPGDIVNFGTYKVKAIKTTHDIQGGSLLYVISENGKNIFYATDTPVLSEETLEQLKEIKMDVIIMDHTFGNTEHSYLHLNSKLFIDQLQKLRQINCIDDETKIYATHISHDGMSYHEQIEEDAAKEGYHIAYDGMIIDI